MPFPNIFFHWLFDERCIELRVRTNLPHIGPAANFHIGLREKASNTAQTIEHSEVERETDNEYEAQEILLFDQVERLSTF